MPCAAFRNFTRAALARFRLSEIVNSTNVLLPTKSLVSFVNCTAILCIVEQPSNRGSFICASR